MDGGGRQTRGLQNRLRGAAEASWVGSIPIHPRHPDVRRGQSPARALVAVEDRNALTNDDTNR